MTPTNHHFFLASARTWMTTGPDRSLTEAIKAMEAEKFTFTIWFVPEPPEAHYEIDWFAPQVKGAFTVDAVEFNKGRRVRSTKETA